MSSNGHLTHKKSLDFNLLLVASCTYMNVSDFQKPFSDISNQICFDILNANQAFEGTISDQRAASRSWVLSIDSKDTSR